LPTELPRPGLGMVAPLGAGPELQEPQRVDRVAAVVPGAVPDLEVEMGSLGVAGRPDRAELLAGRHVVAGLHHDAALEHVHEDVGVWLAVRGEDYVVARGRRLVGDPRYRPRVRRQDRC